MMYEPPAQSASPTHAAYIAFASWAQDAHDPVTARRLMATVDGRWMNQIEQQGSLTDEVSTLRAHVPYIDWDAPERRDLATLYVAARKFERFYMQAIRASGPLC